MGAKWLQEPYHFGVAILGQKRTWLFNTANSGVHVWAKLRHLGTRPPHHPPAALQPPTGLLQLPPQPPVTRVAADLEISLQPPSPSPSSAALGYNSAVLVEPADRDPWCCPPIGLRTPLDETRSSAIGD